MRKNFILDTNVLLHDPNAIYHFADNCVILPIEVIEELGSFKHDISDLGHNARVVSKELDTLRRQGRLGQGVSLPEGGALRVAVADNQDHLGRYGLRLGNGVGNAILNLALGLAAHEPQVPAIIISKSINLRLKADAIGIAAEDYEEALGQELNTEATWQVIPLPAAHLAEARTLGFHRFADRTFRPNEYILLKDENGGRNSLMGRISARDRQLLNVLKALPEDGLLGIRPLNLGQTFAFDALCDDSIKLVSLVGKAGTGKTLLAVAAGLYKVLKEDQYNRLLISRMTVPMGRDIGFLPGDVEAKMRPWMQPIYDAIEMIRDLDRRGGRRNLPKDILDSDEIGIVPLTYIRGRSIANQFMIIDEAQNLTPLEVKTIITRVGSGTKIVVTGDPAQIDNPYLDSRSNGFVYLINRFRDQPLASHIVLNKGERSDLAEAAANLL